MEFHGLPDIEDYLSSHGNGSPIDVSELNHITEAIVAYCDLTKEQANRVLYLFFQEIRSEMLKGNVVDIRGFGQFLISSPAVTSNSKKVFPKFKPKKSLIRRLNNE